jgi:hypothetical protein
MKLRNWVLAAGLALFSWAVVAPPAQADPRDYRDYRYYAGRDRDESRRRDFLRDRMVNLGDKIRIALRERAIGYRKADDLYEKLDDVRDFLRNDRYLTESEFNRRMDDLDEVQGDLREATREHGIRVRRINR